MLRTSFRDPAGRLHRLDDRVYREVYPPAGEALHAFLGSPLGQQLMGAGTVVGSRFVAGRPDGVPDARAVDPAAADEPEIVEHDRIPFPSYAYEWPPRLLYEAGRCTLRLAQELIAEGMGLKDATPENILFRGPAPVFVDLLSIEQRNPREPTWMAYAQFARTFLIPLLLWRRLGIAPHRQFLTRRDGIEPEEAYRLLGAGRLRPPALGLVTLPVWLGRRANPDDPAMYQPRLAADPERARFIYRSILSQLGRSLDGLAPPPGASGWMGYRESHPHGADYLRVKEESVAHALDQARPAKVLDVGCNTGEFSLLAAEKGAAVVAVDTDPQVADALHRRAAAENRDVLPLVVDLSRPTPAVGWRNLENPSFLERATGYFDAVMMLGIIHHFLVSERVPLREIIDLAADLTTDAALLEFVPTTDPLFRRLCRGREALFVDFTEDAFQAACAARFTTALRVPLGRTGRTLYVLRKPDQ